MISVHLIVDLAFCTGVLLAYKPCCNAIKRIISNRRNKIRDEVESSVELENESKAFLNTTVINTKNIDDEISKIINKAYDEYNSLIEQGRKKIERILEMQLYSAAQKMQDGVTEAIQTLKIDLSRVAADVVKDLLLQQEGGSHKDIMSSVSRDLRKKLH